MKPPAVAPVTRRGSYGKGLKYKAEPSALGELTLSCKFRLGHPIVEGCPIRKRREVAGQPINRINDKSTNSLIRLGNRGERTDKVLRAVRQE